MSSQVPISSLTTDELLKLADFERKLADDLDAAFGNVSFGTFTPTLPGLAPASGGGTTNFLRADGTFAKPPGNLAFFNVTDYGASAASADNRAAFAAAIAACAAAGGGTVYIPAAATPYILKRDLSGGGNGQFYSLYLNQLKNIRFLGDGPNSVVKCDADFCANKGQSWVMRVSGCTDITFENFVADGGWGNGFGTADYGSHLALASAGTFFAEDTSEFPAAGSFKLQTKTSIETITYTGKTSKSFTGCTGGTAARVRRGDRIYKFDRSQKATVVSVLSDGAPATSATINVDSTTDFPNTMPLSGYVRINTSVGWQFLKYTGKTATSFTGCSGPTSGTITNATGTIQWVDGAGDQLAASAADMQLDPKNNWFMIYGTLTSNDYVPNSRINFVNMTVRNTYGDGIWLGSSDSIKIEKTRIYGSCRNNITLSNYASKIDIDRCSIKYAATTGIDSEPVEQGTGPVNISRTELFPWVNTAGTSGNQVCSVWGGTTIREAEWNYTHDWTFDGCDIKGNVYLSDAKRVRFVNTRISTQIYGTSLAPIVASMKCENVDIDNCDITAAGGNTSEVNFGAICIVPYRYGTNSAGAPGLVSITNTKIRARDGMAGVYIGAAGGYQGYAGAATYTAPAGGNPGELQFTGTPFAAQLDYFKGHVVEMGGVLALCVGNTSSKLYITPVFAVPNGTPWYDSEGQTALTPANGTARILPNGGWTKMRNVDIDCGRTDEYAAGGIGILFDTTTTWPEGYNDVRISARDVTVRDATGPGVRVWLRGPGAKYCEMIDIKIEDNQPVKTTTVGIDWITPEGWERIKTHGCTAVNGIAPGVAGSLPLQQGLETASYWIAASTFPPTYAGYSDPNGLIYAPKGSKYIWTGANVVQQKQSAEQFSTGWVEEKTSVYTSFRTAGSMVGNLVFNTAVPVPNTPSVNNDIEFLWVLRNGPTAITLSTTGGFTAIAGEASATYPSFAGVTMYGKLFYRRVSGTKTAPVIAAGLGTQYIAKIFAIKDCITTGSPLDIAATTSTDPAGALSFSLTGGTTVSDGDFVATFVACFMGGSNATASLTTYAQASLTELTREVDQNSLLGGPERFLMSLVTGRQAALGALGNFTGTVVSSGGYSFTVAMQVALKPRVES